VTAPCDQAIFIDNTTSPENQNRKIDPIDLNMINLSGIMQTESEKDKQMPHQNDQGESYFML
jgi:hypothetical protein